jgi:copper resistance protein C
MIRVNKAIVELFGVIAQLISSSTTSSRIGLANHYFRSAELRRGLCVATLLVVRLTASEAAIAHALLVKAVPSVGGTVSASPSEIRIIFSEAVEPRFSGIAVKAADGRAVATGVSTVDPGDHATLIVPVKTQLQPGHYKVNWRVVSADTHTTQGSFSFEVKP